MATPRGNSDRGNGGGPREVPGGAPVPAASLSAALLAFYDTRRRDLPWRGQDDPYRVWVSEVMLQQTRVDTVLPYYRAWMERFPDLEALAAAALDDVLKAWEGLGYYRRARDLHRAARLVRDRHGGRMPGRAAELRSLPGVGEYTAGAVASIAFGEAVPAVDGNVRRVMARLLDAPDPRGTRVRDAAAALVDPGRPGDSNQALMDLGATVCTPRDPACGDCPLRDGCLALQRGTVAERPAPRRRAPVPEVVFGVAVLVRPVAGGGGGAALLTRRPDDGLLGGTWEFPGLRAADGDPGAAARRAARAAGVDPPGPPHTLPEVVQLYSHFRGRYLPFLWEGDFTSPPDGERARWAGPDGLAGLTLSRAQRRIARALGKPHLGGVPSVASADPP